jgi:Tfp pilus assembly ATPase PilU
VPRYFFHADDGTPDRDEEGTELDDLAAAKCHAVKYASDLICDGTTDFWGNMDWRMSVSDQTGLTLFDLHIVGTEAAAVRR